MKKICYIFVMAAFEVAYADSLLPGISNSATAATMLFGSQATTGSQASDPSGNNSSMVPPIQNSSPSSFDSSAIGSTVISNSQPNEVNHAAPSTSLRSQRPPVTPNEFQYNVQTRTGLYLKQFGYGLFDIPTTFTPVNNLPMDNNYVLGPGDQIFIQAWGSISMSYTAVVNPDGTIFIPRVGTFNLAGIKAASLDGYLKAQVGKVYKKFQLSATISKIRSIQVNVTGYAQAPGTYTVSSLTSLSNAVYAAGGPAANGSLRHIELRRNGVTVEDFDMYRILLRGDSSTDARLLPGDIIYFAPKGDEVAIYDGVKIPAIYEARRGETVGDTLKFAGGATFDNSKNKVVIEQISKNSEILVKDYAYKIGLTQQLSDGDIVHFMRMNKKYESTVVLMGNVANPTRLQYRPGMRVNDVIPTKDALLTKSFWDSYSYNTYGRDYALTQTGSEKTLNRFTNRSPDYSYSSGMTASNQADSIVGGGANLLRNPSPLTNNLNSTESNQVFFNSDNLQVAGPLNIPVADINWNYAAIIRIDPQDYSSHVIAFDLAQAIAGDLQNNILLQPGDVINILSNKDVRNPVENFPVFVFVDGEVVKPGVYELKTGESLGAVITRAGGVTKKAYLFGMQINRIAVRKKQQIVLNQMLDQAQQALLAQSSAAGLNVINPAQVQVQAQILSQQQALIDKMRQIKPVGRIILKRVKPTTKLVSELPDFEIENGDTVYIPPRSNTIDVIGQVYNPATFDLDSKLEIQNYIEMAGTENDFADIQNEYLLQANGTLYSRKQAGWFGGFGSRELNPGDTIIIPQKIQFGSGMQSLLNWTQILANFGTSAAAIQVFKN